MEALLLGKVSQTETIALQDSAGKTIHPAETQPTDAYRISEIDEEDETAFFGFTDTKGAWFIMKKEENSGSFRYTKGKANFAANWAGRKLLGYDYYHNVFP